VSLCGNVDLSDRKHAAIYNKSDSAYLQYRFGTSSNTEMVYPKQQKSSFEKFGGGNIRNYFGALQEVAFSVRRYRYTISSESFAQNDERTDVKGFNGIRVWEGDSLQPKELYCATSPFRDSLRKRDTSEDFNIITDQLSELHSK
jgi:hypothetical protein